MARRIPQSNRAAPAQEISSLQDRHEVVMERRGVQPAGSLKDASLVILQSTALS
jgi:hypothetical protein